ncbi:hypothetical protein LCGC14_2071490 [marine sediment metagenome]|uniref:Uncharacterized protein n=1 Tax=marine sediment metagenome TaxID=412755 RepID=A0A0F9F5N6_9ZZZZ
MNEQDRLAMEQDQAPKEVTFRQQPNYGDLLTLEEFREQLRIGGIVSSDGCGYYASATQESNVPVVFDADYVIELPGLTHVMWYNK